MYEVVIYFDDSLGRDIYRHYFPDAHCVSSIEEAITRACHSNCITVCINSFSRPSVSAKTFHRLIAANLCDYLILGCDPYLGFLVSPQYARKLNCKNLEGKRAPVIMVYDPVNPNFTCCLPESKDDNKCVGKAWKIAAIVLAVVIGLLLLFFVISLFSRKKKKKEEPKQCVVTPQSPRPTSPRPKKKEVIVVDEPKVEEIIITPQPIVKEKEFVIDL